MNSSFFQIRKKLSCIPILVAVCVGSSNIAFAQNSFNGSYSFTGKTGSEVSDPATSMTGAGFSSISRGAGLNANAGANSFNSNGFATGTTLDTTNNDYLTLTITPSAGTSINLASITAPYQISGTGPKSFDLRTSFDSFATSIQTTSYTATTGTINFSNIGVTSTAPLELRFYGYNSGGAAGTFRLTNTLSVDGTFDTTPAPPGIVSAGIGMGVTGLGALYRRRKQANVDTEDETLQTA